MIVNGVSSAALPQPQPQPPAHIVKRGDTLGSIAKEHQVDLKDLQKANPQILNPDVLYPGQHVNLPPGAPAEAAEPGISTGSGTLKGPETKTGTDAHGTSQQSSVTGKVNESGGDVSASNTGKATTTDHNGTQTTSGRTSSGGVSWDTSKGTVSVSRGTEFSQAVKTSKGVGLSFSVGGNAKLTGGQITKDGVTTYTVASDVSVTLKAGVSVKQAGVEVGHTDGIKASYQVAMPEQAAKTTKLTSVNPFDPSSMPKGTKITMDGSTYTNNEFKATFRNIAVQTKIGDEKGVSTVVEKTGDHTVRVTAGPKEAIDAYNGVGIDFDQARAMLGRSDKLAGSTLKTAEFDLATPEGKAAYADYLGTGKLPTANGSGVSGVSTTEKVDFSSQSQVDLKLGPLEATLGGPKNTANWVTTSYPDGSKVATTNVQYSGNVPMTVTAKFDPTGKEIVAERRYGYTIKADANIAQMLNVAQTGDTGQAQSGPIKAGQTVTLTYTQDQMRQLMVDAQHATTFGDMQLQALTQDYDGKFVNDPERFALGLARNLNGSDYGSAERLYHISLGAGTKDGRPHGFTPLPGSITVSNG